MHIIKTEFCISSATCCGISSSCRRMHGVAVMRCKKQTAVCFLMIYTALRAVMICQACGLDKKIRQVETCRIFWLGNRDFYRLACARCDSANSPQESLFALRRIPFAVRIPILILHKQKSSISNEILLFSGWGIGIRTPTNRVRVCRATVTLFPIAKSIIYILRENVNTFFKNIFHFYFYIYIVSFQKI